jgi:hypothetical protein
VIKLGDTVLYTTARLTVRAALITNVNADGSVELCCFDSRQRRLEWHSNVRVTGEPAGTEGAAERWAHR